MATVIQITEMSVDQTSGAATLNYTINGHRRGMVFRSKEAAIEWLQRDEDDVQTLVKLLLRYARFRDPNINPADVVGHSITLDFAQASNILSVA